ncbi:RecQ family ATP-dependent DNA helicase [Granulicella sp. WH15]|uniref:RecQ family ATP-dependent DNA helicase n=1 Tax=Granulicella sp. WH15 TaxID=2602070 RepID=UPI0013676415|nr:RecQ family ATP-dependent DNA helicase [Granulicella sp. WH15]QHN03687.1 RecQ family ATP-dependent DNA helicase [Granulicella sp. WH15]
MNQAPQKHASSNLASLLHSTFGFSAFRANQEAVCRAATDGRDVLLVMPTGAGKSLCYQLPAIARGGTGLVISPLIALMDDQASKLTAAGLRVARIHSGLSREDARQACRDYLDGTLQFLFIAPERMRVPGFPEMLAKRKPSLIAIDEAHCISAWGHDFRPDYRTLGEYLPSLRPAPIIALTATATPTVQKDIVAQLNLSQPALFIHGFRRENLAIEVVELSKPQRTAFASKYLQSPTARPAIVYAPSRKAAEDLASELGRHFPAAAYHAGLDPGTRERVQRHFLGGKLDVVVATIAFGMGIDKADVRTVIHTALPASVEAYYQEIGRAGRDGLPSRTVLLHSYQDRKMHEFFLDRDYPPLTDLARVAQVLTDEFEMPEALAAKLRMDRDVFAKSVEKLAAQGAAQIDMNNLVRRSPNASTAWQSGYDQQIAFRRSQIDRMVQFAETAQCRMSALIRHFGDTADGHRPCGHCDFCAPSGTMAQSFAAPSSSEDHDLRTILRELDGGKSKATGRLFTDTAITKDRKHFDSLLDGLARAGLITLTADSWTNPEGKVLNYKKAALTHEGRTLGPGNPLGVVLRSAQPGSGSSAPRKKAKSAAATAEQANYTPAQTLLETSLREWRKAEAAQTGKPAFIVFSDSSLRALVLAAPKTIPELLTVSGIGPDKADRYGAAICAICSGREAPGEFGAPAPKTKTTPKPVQKSFAQPAAPTPSSSPRPIQASSSREPETFTRQRVATADPADALDPAQRILDERLREWRKVESEKIGLPQFFVLGTTTLRSIVLARPQNLTQLRSISGMGPEKTDRFGASILAICNS